MKTSPEKLVRTRVSEAVALVEGLAEAELLDAIVAAAVELADRLEAGGKVLACGNGGSAALAEHFVAELVGRFQLEREPIAAVALGSNISTLTAISNDYDFDKAFARETRALASPGDVVVGFSTSGRSLNVLAAFEAARAIGASRIAVVGSDSSAIAPLADHVIAVPTDHTPRVQELHALVCHVLCEIAEAEVTAARDG